MSNFTLLNTERIALINQYATQLETNEQEVLIKVLRRMVAKAAAQRVDRAAQKSQTLSEQDVLNEIKTYREEKLKASKA